MSVIPCQLNEDLDQKIKDFAETLKTESHTLGDHGLDEKEFYNSGLFRGAIERVRGQFSDTVRTTQITRNARIQRESDPTVIGRS